MYLIYRRGIAIRLTVIISICLAVAAGVAFFLGREGAALARLGIALVLVVPTIIVLLNVMVRQIVTPAKQMASIAATIATGDVNQQVDFTRQDEFGDLANAFRDMIAYLQEMADAADHLAQGDLTAEVTPQSEQDRLGNAFSQMIINLNNIIRQATTAAEQVVPSVEQIRAISQSLAGSAEEQSAAAEEVASSLEQTGAQVKSNAESAGVANQLVGQTTDVASAGQEKMKAMTKAMDGIATSSQEISRIIKVIDEIAFQTNLLALNAAVEAARAGQHGRGFAVVAQEVRNLAERSARAARETAELIEDAGRRVEEGVGMADETAYALGEIVQNVLKVKDLVAEIAAASEEQARGVAQVDAAMMQVTQGAQAGSQQSEELASTADELGQLAEVLRNQASRFKLREDGNARELAAMTPEMLRQVAQMVRAQVVAGDGGAAVAKPQALVRGEPVGDDGLKLPLDRDERGYGEF
jgi:methyl-accepting chemotaxis protein